MIHKSFLTFFSASLLSIKVIMVFLLVSLSMIVKAQETFFIPLQSDLRSSDPLLDSLVNKSLFTTSRNSIRKILANEPDRWDLIIPLENESNWVLALEKVKIWDNLASIETASGKKVSLPSEGVHYRGTVKGHKGSLVSMSIFLMLFFEVVNKDLFTKLSSNESDVLISDCKGIKKASCAFTNIDSDTSKKTIITLIFSK